MPGTAASAGSSSSSSRGLPRSLPYDVEFSLTSTSSRTPWPASHPASATRSSGGRDRNAPRNAGIAQKLHRRSHPDAILSGATGPPDSRRRSVRGPDAGASPGGRSGIPRRAMPRRLAARVRGPGRGRDRQQPAPVPRLMSGAPFPGQDGVQPGPDVSVIVEAEHLRLGQLGRQVAAVPLGQAARGHHLRAAPGGVEQLADRLLLGRLDEPAGVHQHDAGLIAARTGSTPRPPAGPRAPRNPPRCARSPASRG